MHNPKESVFTQNGKRLAALDKFITELISSRMGIKPEQVTTEFIHVWREEELYPSAYIEIETAGRTFSKSLKGSNLVTHKSRLGSKIKS
jgi:hypothetical protein